MYDLSPSLTDVPLPLLSAVWVNAFYIKPSHKHIFLHLFRWRNWPGDSSRISSKQPKNVVNVHLTTQVKTFPESSDIHKAWENSFTYNGCPLPTAPSCGSLTSEIKRVECSFTPQLQQMVLTTLEQQDWDADPFRQGLTPPQMPGDHMHPYGKRPQSRPTGMLCLVSTVLVDSLERDNNLLKKCRFSDWLNWPSLAERLPLTLPFCPSHPGQSCGWQTYKKQRFKIYKLLNPSFFLK